ncbi:hypothetical protein HDU97_002956 [Phlyctochytrium planicorne]|nr:hypothetical protein HDU97_002956 [Phlyctochytrium planicorne]
MTVGFGMLSALPSELVNAILRETQDWKLVVELEAINANLPHLYPDAGQALAGIVLADVFPAASFLIKQQKDLYIAEMDGFDSERVTTCFIEQYTEGGLTLLQAAFHATVTNDLSHMRPILLKNLSSAKILSYFHARPDSDDLFRPQLDETFRRGFNLFFSVEPDQSARSSALSDLLFADGDDVARDSDKTTLFHVMDHAASKGILSAVQFLNENRSEGCGITAMSAAAANNHLEVVKYLHIHRSEGCDTAAVDLCATRGHVDVLEFLLRNRNEGFTWRALVYAAMNDHFGILKRLHDENRLDPADIPVDFGILNHAAGTGNVAVVAFLHSNGYVGCTYEAMDLAAKGGHLDVVRYLNDHRDEGCSIDAMDYAAACGHLEVVKYLHFNRKEGCSTVAMDRAAAFGHLDVVRFLHEHRDEGCTTSAMEWAAGGGHLEIVRFLKEHRKEVLSAKALECAAAKGGLEVVKYFFENGGEGFSPRAMEIAAARKQLHMMWFLRFECGVPFTRQALLSYHIGFYRSKTVLGKEEEDVEHSWMLVELVEVVVDREYVPDGGDDYISW